MRMPAGDGIIHDDLAVDSHQIDDLVFTDQTRHHGHIKNFANLTLAEDPLRGSGGNLFRQLPFYLLFRQSA